MDALEVTERLDQVLSIGFSVVVIDLAQTIQMNSRYVVQHD
jgi:hypothetical protein